MKLITTLTIAIAIPMLLKADTTLSLQSNMDGSSSFAEYDITGVISQINFGAGTAGDADGFYNVNDTSQQFGTADLFPGETLFGIGSLVYDELLLTGSGAETIAIKSLDLSSFWTAGSSTTDINDASGLDFQFFDSNSEWVFGALDAADTVSFLNGSLTGIDLDITAEFLADYAGSSLASYTGSFTVSGFNLSLQIDDTALNVSTFAGTAPQSRLVADFTGTVIPEPATGLLLGMGLMSVLLRRRKR